MAETVEVPPSLVRKMARAAEAFALLEHEIEDYFLSQDPEFVSRMREARAAHLSKNLRSLSELKRELCIQ